MKPQQQSILNEIGDLGLGQYDIILEDEKQKETESDKED